VILEANDKEATNLQVSLRYAAVNSNPASFASSGYSVTGGGCAELPLRPGFERSQGVFFVWL
jgi:hypothetical protein